MSPNILIKEDTPTTDDKNTTDIALLGLSQKKLKKAAITSYPTPLAHNENPLSDEEKIAKIEQRYREILQILGLDLENDSIAHTSYRIAKMYVKEIFSGLNVENFPSLCFIEDSSAKDATQIILVKNVRLTSYCEHHFVPMTGTAHIAYLPNKKIIGLSKINRIADYFCRRPQLQERLTAQIADSLRTVLDTDDVAVFTQMNHFCVNNRGVCDKDSMTETYVLNGKFKKDRFHRQEFFTKIS